jgi:hypothetical protein
MDGKTLGMLVYPVKRYLAGCMAVIYQEGTFYSVQDNA